LFSRAEHLALQIFPNFFLGMLHFTNPSASASFGAAGRSSHFEQIPGGLWSLWDMLELNASAFYQVVTVLRHAQGQIRSDRENAASNYHKQKHLTDGAIKSFTACLYQLNESLDILDLKMTKILSLDLIRMALDTKKPLKYDTVFALVEDLDRRLKDELTLRKLFVIDEKRAAFYQPSTPHFGQDVSDKFPSATYDIEEAGKCLGVRRSTACVTHLMRAIEPGLNSLATALNVNFDRVNWNTILDQVENAIVAIGTGPGPHPPNWRADKQYYSEAAVHLRLIKDAWRNHAMHLRDRYDEERAEAVFLNVRSVMKHLAIRLSEPPP
jgi:hypothetical protein